MIFYYCYATGIFWIRGIGQSKVGKLAPSQGRRLSASKDRYYLCLHS
jgi:hypothetical protein